MVSSRSVHPDRAGSGPAPAYPRFPNILALVQEEENARYLQALLPALEKYNCLHFTTIKPRRSSWVRAFCDLHHPSGPWGRFSNVPAITSYLRYRFKSYKIPKIHKELQKYKGSNQVHIQLRQALDRYFEKATYHKEYMAACEAMCLQQVNRPTAERAPIPSCSADLVATSTSGAVITLLDNGDNVDTQNPDSSTTAPGAMDAEEENVSQNNHRASTPGPSELSEQVSDRQQSPALLDASQEAVEMDSVGSHQHVAPDPGGALEARATLPTDVRMQDDDDSTAANLDTTIGSTTPMIDQEGIVHFTSPMIDPEGRVHFADNYNPVSIHGQPEPEQVIGGARGQSLNVAVAAGSLEISGTSSGDSLESHQQGNSAVPGAASDEQNGPSQDGPDANKNSESVNSPPQIDSITNRNVNESEQEMNAAGSLPNRDVAEATVVRLNESLNANEEQQSRKRRALENDGMDDSDRPTQRQRVQEEQPEEEHEFDEGPADTAWDNDELPNSSAVDGSAVSTQHVSNATGAADAAPVTPSSPPRRCSAQFPSSPAVCLRLATPSAVQVTGPPIATQDTTATVNKKQKIQDTRAELLALLELRRQGRTDFETDAVCRKIQNKIDELDEILFELIASSFLE